MSGNIRFKLFLTLVITLLLTAPVIYSVTLRFGNDGTDQWFNDVSYIKNGNGKIFPVTEKGFKDAINDLNHTGGVVYLPANTTISLTHSIEIGHDNITIIGSGRRTNITQTVNNKNAFVVSGATNCVFRDFFVRCADDTGTNMAFNIDSSAHRTLVDNVYIENFGNNGIQVSSSDQVTITNCHIYDCGTGTGANSAIYVLASTFGDFSNNIIWECYGGITLSNGDRCVISDNNIKGNEYEAVALEAGSNDNTVSGNVLAECKHHGLYIDASSYNLITGNQIVANDYDNTATYDGINISGTSSTTTIVGNRIGDNDNYEIHLDSSATIASTVIVGNQMHGSDRVGLLKYDGTGVTATVIQANDGMVTESWGRKNCTDKVTIAHNLSFTPTSVVAVCEYPGIIVSVDNIGATNFRVKLRSHTGGVVNNIRVYWIARV